MQWSKAHQSFTFPIQSEINFAQDVLFNTVTKHKNVYLDGNIVLDYFSCTESAILQEITGVKNCVC